MPNHLLDGREQVSPRSFAAALRYAAAVTETLDDWPYPLHYKAIQQGVQEASWVRVHEITTEDYPWINLVMEPLRRQITVPCSKDDIIEIWRFSRIIETLTSQIQDDQVKLPPQHFEDGPEGVLTDLAQLGLVQFLTGDRVQMPDVYRIAFGLGRRGGWC